MDKKWPGDRKLKTGSQQISHLAEASFRIDAVGVLLAVRADVPLLLAHKTRRVREATICLLGLGTYPQGVLGGAAVEADPRVRLINIASRKGGWWSA